MPSIQEILQKEDFGQVVHTLCVDTMDGRKPQEYRAEFEGERKRRRTSVGWREAKRLEVYSDSLVDGNGNPLRLGDKVVDVARIVTNFPKKIVRTSVAFMFGGGMSISAQEQNEGFEEFKRVFERKLKMHSRLKEFARKVLSETKAAFVFYPYAVQGMDGSIVTELRVKILSAPQKTGTLYEFYPHFDGNDDMDGFIHRFNVNVEGMVRERVVIWTKEKVTTATQGWQGWDKTEAPNLFGKIPVVYAEVGRPEWDDVAVLMDAREMRLSRTADTNDYFAEPIMKTFGETNLPGKNTVGKEIHFPPVQDTDTGKEYHGDAEFMSWNQSIDSVKQELEDVKAEMFGGSSTPNLAFDNLKGIGNLSGVARRFMALDATIKASENMEVFFPVVQRCISIVTAGICNITNIKYHQQLVDNWIEVSFESILPKDAVEDAQVLSIAGGGKAFNSQETIVSHSPLTPPGDIQGELAKMAQEERNQAELDRMAGATALY